MTEEWFPIIMLVLNVVLWFAAGYFVGLIKGSKRYAAKLSEYAKRFATQSRAFNELADRYQTIRKGYEQMTAKNRPPY